jgi:hypothetical protein
MDGHAADVAGVAFDLARVDARADLQTFLLGAVSDRIGAPNPSTRAYAGGVFRLRAPRDASKPRFGTPREAGSALI